jgi:phycocyanobilin:ferredoxin oxidoreductase
VSDGFDFVALTLETEAWLVRELALLPVAVDPALAFAEGSWKGEHVTIETRAYRSDTIRQARFAVVKGPSLEIGNIVCLPDFAQPLPILGADLVAIRREQGMVAVDLSPTLPVGPEREAQFAGLAARLTAHPELPSGGVLPDWCTNWFSPLALYTRVPLSQRDAAASVFREFPRYFVELAQHSVARPELQSNAARVQDGYMAAHRTDDRGLGLLAKMFGTAWTERYINELLFPPVEVPSSR